MNTRRGREVETSSLSIETKPDLIIPGLGEELYREPEEIAALDSPMEKDYFKEVEFMEDVLTIRIEPGREKNAPQLIDVYVNGRAEWVPVGKPWKLKRKYVEVLARAKPMSIQTSHESAEESADPQNRVIRSVSSMHPFTVINDPSQKGYEWLTRILQEG